LSCISKYINGSLSSGTTKFLVYGSQLSGKEVLPNEYVHNGTFNDIYWHYDKISSRDKIENLMYAYGINDVILAGGSTQSLSGSSRFPGLNMQGACSRNDILFNCNSLNHIIIATDDNETLPPFGSNQNEIRDSFITSLTSHFTPNSNSFRVHSIYATQTGAESSCSIARQGLIYTDLTNLTGGYAHDICEADWGPVFDALKDNIVNSANGLKILECPGSNRSLTSVVVRTAGFNEVKLNPGDYQFNNAGQTATLSISTAALTAHGLPVAAGTQYTVNVRYVIN